MQQSIVLQVADVNWIHKALLDPDFCDYDRAFFGFLLVGIYGRCKFSDLACIHAIEHDYDEHGGFLEITTVHFKTARTVAAKHTFLPIVIPALSIKNELWIPDVEEAFNRVGAKFRGTINGPLLPAPSGCR